MKRISSLLLIVSFIVSCIPSPTPNPTLNPSLVLIPTPSLIPLLEIDLEPILIQDGDLPPGYYEAQVREVPNDSYKWIINKGLNNIQQYIGLNDDIGGSVTIYLYEDTIALNTAYEQQSDSFGELSDSPKPGYQTSYLDGIGEKAKYLTFDEKSYGDEFDQTALVFKRCHALVDISFYQTYNLDYIVSYSKRIDRRISDLVCE